MKKIIFTVFLTLFFSYTPKIFAENSYLSDRITLNNKKIMANYAFSVIKALIGKTAIPDIPPDFNLNLEYDSIFISIYKKNKIIDSWGFKSDEENPNGIFIDIKNSIIQSVKNNPEEIIFYNNLSKDIYIIISILYNKKIIPKNTLEYCKKNIAPGIHSISVKKENKEAYYISYTLPENNINIEMALKHLCQKANLSKICYMNNSVQIAKYDTEVFKADQHNNIVTLQRFNIYLNAKNINQKTIANSISLIKNWFLNNINPDTKLLEYIYYPNLNKNSRKFNNHTRQLASLWAVTELKHFLKTNSLDNLINNTIHYYLSFLKFENNYSYINAEKDPTIGLNAFMIMSLINIEIPNKKKILESLAEGILSMQQPDGSFLTNFTSKKIFAKDYLPGEAMLSLMKLYNITKNSKYLNAVDKAFYYYRSYWRKNKNTAFIPWHTQAYYLLHKKTQKKEIAEFVFEMNNWLINNFQIFQNQYIDNIGGFPKDNPLPCSTAVYMEGINKAYSLAKKIGNFQNQKKYKKSIIKATRFLLQAQFNKTNSFYLENPKKAIGGIRASYTQNLQRVDCVQHAVMALIKTYQNKIFQ